MIHRLLHGHWPVWEKYDYDFLTWKWRCQICRMNPSQPRRRRTR